MLVVVIVVFMPAILATRELKNYCGQLAIGAPLAELQSQAEAAGYRFSPVVGGRAFVDDVRSFGRPSCNLQFSDQGLVAAEYSSND
jgi:hypothetical protein